MLLLSLNCALPVKKFHSTLQCAPRLLEGALFLQKLGSSAAFWSVAGGAVARALLPAAVAVAVHPAPPPQNGAKDLWWIVYGSMVGSCWGSVVSAQVQLVVASESG